MAEAASDDRREQMLRAAIDVIAERGFPETRISDIGRRVGASSALVIYYFGTKDRLLTDALRYSEDLFYAEAARRLDAIEGARDKIEALVQMSCSSGGTDGLPGSWLLWPDLWAQAVRHPEVVQGPRGARPALAREGGRDRARRCRPAASSRRSTSTTSPWS